MANARQDTVRSPATRRPRGRRIASQDEVGQTTCYARDGINVLQEKDERFRREHP